MSSKCLMVQGTTSDAGKSTLVTALCRLLKRRGMSVAPFKPQNMALNSAVTPEGGEIGRAQAVQAYAAGIGPHVDMSPILLKPNTDTGAQVIIQGKAIGNMNAVGYHEYKLIAKKASLQSFSRLCDQYDWVLVEGAGSPAEINLRSRDIANMGFAESVNCPVIIIADIDKGGVFAHLVGTLELLSQSEQDRVIGFVINRFRGDLSLLQSGLDWLEKKTGKTVLGVLPYLKGFYLESEDAVTQHNQDAGPLLNSPTETLRVVIPITPRVSNHTDWDPLNLHPQVHVTLVNANQPIPPADLIILPGSKSVQSDLTYLKEQGWEAHLNKHLRYGGKVLGICGGYQMLGQSLNDPLGLENNTASEIDGFNFIPMTTKLENEKQLSLQQGEINKHSPWLSKSHITGYEIHSGVSTHHQPYEPFSTLECGQLEGYISEDGQIIGSYLHGLFDHPDALESLLKWAGLKNISPFNYDLYRNAEIERLAKSCEEHINIDALLKQASKFTLSL
ncbi:cobyric acid synthase [Marinomonas sp. 2405UD68-3]|uniref:cobyric acid synthase n=1 Tax=Marinomonas sp. 2405UD68-3 TaxID=3391835 RepID=UPI0039C8E011